MHKIKKVQFKDGSYAFVKDNSDLVALIGSFMGKDVQQSVLEIVQESDYTAKAIQTDLSYYEESIVAQREALNEIQNNADKLIEDIQKSKRLDRDMCVNVLQIISRTAKINA